VREVYLDYNASSPLDPRVAEAMMPILTDSVGNASSVHRFGRRQAAVVDDAREHVAALVGGRASGVVFTSGATEANNLVLQGALEAAPKSRRRMLVSAVEHASVAGTARLLADFGLVKLEVIEVTSGGFVEPATVEEMVGDDVLLVSVMAANSETGVLNPVGEIAERVRAAGALFHCDATQMAGRLPFDMEALGVDLVSLSGHKICGPGGVGALVGTRHSLRQLEALLHGGGHERGLRSGSLNVAGIVGFGAAARIAADERERESETVGALRDRLVSELQASIPRVLQNGDPSRRLPNTANLCFVGADAEAVMANMDPVAVSIGSACSSGSIEPSEVLLAMGRSHETAFESVRFSLGRFTTEAQIDTAVDSATAAVQRVRALT
jgi:cysteine desulfurase